MAEKKADILKAAQAQGLEVTAKNTVVEIKAALKNATTKEVSEEPTKPASETAETEAKETTAKAGKRSAKALKEADEEAEKEQRKEKIAKGEIDPSTDADGEVAAKKGPVPVTKPLIERRSKNYRKNAEKVKSNQAVPVAEAMALAKQTSSVKFDASIELHIRLNVDPKQADQNIRGSLVLPHGTGSTQRVAVFAPADQHEAAKKAGADIVAAEELLDDLQKEKIDFDVLVATPDMMAQLGKFAKLLGPKGLMPNPKSGTVTKDVAKAVKEAKAGRVEYRVDASGIIHNKVGKVSFSESDLTNNTQALLEAVKAARPSSLKGDYILSISVSSSMGPGIKVSAQ